MSRQAAALADQLGLIGEAAHTVEQILLAASPQPGSSLEGEASVDPTAIVDKLAEASAAAALKETRCVARKLKLQKLVDARGAHAQNFLDKWVTILVRPTDAADLGYLKVFGESVLLTGCDALKRNGIQRHAWLFDPSADVEPCGIGIGGSVWKKACAVDEAACRQFFSAVARYVLPAGAVGLNMYADGRGKHNLTCLYRLAGKGKFTNYDSEELNVIYKESVALNRTHRENTHETIVGLVPGGTSQLGQFGARLHFTQTGTNSNSIVIATTVSQTEAALVSLATKVVILGLEAVLPREKEMFIMAKKDQASPPQGVLEKAGETQGETQGKLTGATQGEEEEAVLLFHQEKSQQVSEEILHHFGVTSLCTTTPGSGEILRAAVCLQIPVLAFSKNDAHAAWLREGLRVWAVGNQQW